MDNNNKISRSIFDKQFQIIFGEEQTVNSGTSLPIFNQKQAFLKNRNTGEIIPTSIFSSNEEFGELMVFESYCTDD